MSLLLTILTIALPADRHPQHHAGHHQGCRTYRCDHRVTRRYRDRKRRRWKQVEAPQHAYLTRIAACESGGRWKINTGNGYYGGLQFSLPSWRAVGGSGYPHHATELEQRYRAVRLSRLQGWGAWPVCSR